MVAIVERPREPVCESCLDAADETEFSGATAFMLDEDEKILIMREFGNEVADHLCDEIESDGDIRCGCGCKRKGKRQLRKWLLEHK